MASVKTTEEPKNTAPQETPHASATAPRDYDNLAAKLPIYDALAGKGDGRSAEVGQKGHPIHGRMLGTIDLPSTQKNDRGEIQPWVGVVIELLEPAPVRESKNGKVSRRMAIAGERIIMTESAAFKRFSKIADHPTKVYTAWIEPEFAKSRALNRNLWTYPTVAVDKNHPIERTNDHLVGVADLFDEIEAGEAPKALGSGGAAASA